MIAAIAAAAGYRLPASSSSTGTSPIDVLRDIRGGASSGADGAVPDGATVFRDEIPAIGRLDPALLGALRHAATDAGIDFVVEGGWRSPEYQEHLLREAVAKYGSHAEAARWVATPTTSAHVSGDAVDLGPAATAAWVSAHGARYGLCQIYGNEPWHFELRPAAATYGCPRMYPDPTHDPRMQPRPRELALPGGRRARSSDGGLGRGGS